ncbi:MAG: ferritin family protein [Hyphomicrobiales bacterium]|nr:ferritin family protein [Hyphomicrobiales bacterium]
MKSLDKPGSAPTFDSVAEFFAQALAIEIEAWERYGELADQMETHNNHVIADIFRKMAHIEGMHRDEIKRRAGDALVGGRPASFSWLAPEGPEAIDLGDVHYKMTPRQALMLARHNEERATRYFEAIAEAATDPEIKAFAQIMAEDERHHVVLVDQWLDKFDPDDPDWAEDLDPPVISE